MRLRYKRSELAYPKQEAFINDLAQYVYVEAGTKSGKTVGMIIWIHEEMIASRSGQNFVWLAPNASTAKMAFLRLWEQHIPNAHKRFYKINYSERSIQYPNGGRLWFVGADRPDMLYGRDYDGVIIDEASRIKEAAYIAMLSTLATTNGALRAIGNTRGKNNWFYRECQKAKAKAAAETREGVHHYHSLTSFDNPANDHAHILD
jgi:phage terminase large subunit